jgi:hypothetical protein
MTDAESSLMMKVWTTSINREDENHHDVADAATR